MTLTFRPKICSASY